MYRSLFSKYLTAFLLIIVSAFAILIAAIGAMMSDYSKEVNGEVISRSLSGMKSYIEVEYSELDSEDFNRFVFYKSDKIKELFMSMTGSSDDTFMFVTDTDGTVLLSGGYADVDISDGSVSPAVLNDIAATEQLRLREGDLEGILPADYVVYASALKDDSETDLGAVFVCIHSSVINAFGNAMIKMIIMECLWVLLAALMVVYFISERITRPLKSISIAAKSFASGQFDVRVPVVGHNEIADLATAFNNMAATLATNEETRRAFLANVSHDLRTPMTTIAGFIDGILDGAIPAEKHEYYLGIIASEVRRLSRLVTTLLDITRIQAGERKFNMERFDICEMAKLILISFEQRIDEKKLEISFECDSDKLYVLADRDAIYQVFYNICDNAVKFSNEGGAYKISLISKSGKVYVSVYNEGQGISEDEIAQVFDRFYKSDKSRGLDKTGTGLGLYITKTIIDAHGEQIWVRSVYGKFCEFIFTLQHTYEPKDAKELKDAKNS